MVSSQELLGSCQEPILDQTNFEARGILNPSHTFDTLKMVKGSERAIQSFRELADGDALFSLLMVYGGTGNGKTRMCEAVVLRLYDRGIFSTRQRWCDIVRTMKSCFNGRGSLPYDDYFKAIRGSQRLIIDDVGSGSTLGQWEWGELEDIIDYRYERNLFTILITNLDIKQFPERILSRFRDMSKARLILNEAPDQRPIQEKR